MMKPSLILVNPWIYDFAAYDYWSKPLGLLCIAGYLRSRGFEIHLIDCLDVYHPKMPGNSKMKLPKRRLYGTGKFWRQPIRAPYPLRKVLRPYSRYGITAELFKTQLEEIKSPSAVLITSLMTYWYPGVREVIRIVRETHPGVPLILGGIYATLCEEHASNNMAVDRIVTSREAEVLTKVLGDYEIYPPFSVDEPHISFYPGFDMLTRIGYVCLMTSSGCPYRCRYCASHFLNPKMERKDPQEVIEEITYWSREFGVRDFAFYDDALLVSPDETTIRLLKGIADLKSDLRFHTPNAVHAREITKEVGCLMKLAGFTTIRLGLETSDFSDNRVFDSKISQGEFERAVKNLLLAGFAGSEIGAYVMMGLPGQSVESVGETVDFVAKSGAVPYLSDYSPIPHTPLWEEALMCSELDLASEPLYQNNTLLPCWDDSKKAEIPRLKKRVLEIRSERIRHS